MAFRTQAPTQLTLIIAVILWLIGFLGHFAIIPSVTGVVAFWCLAVAGLLLILGALIKGL